MSKLPSFSVFWRKSVIIAYMSIVNFVFTSIIAQVLAKYIFVKYNKDKNRYVNMVIFFTGIVCVAVSAYVLRNISMLIPKPLKTSSFDPNLVAENKTSILTAFTYFLYLDKNVVSYMPLFNIL
jgi:hypothetical protein